MSSQIELDLYYNPKQTIQIKQKKDNIVIFFIYNLSKFILKKIIYTKKETSRHFILDSKLNKKPHKQREKKIILNINFRFLENFF